MNSFGECPFSVESNPVEGRYLEATKDIKEGEIIFQERPLLIAPCGIDKSKLFSTCLGCYRNVTSNYKCSKCGWPLCNLQCELIPDHANFECEVLACNPVSPITSPFEYEKIKILRCLLLKEKKNQEKWKLLTNLQSHISNRRQDFAAVSRDISYYKFIKDECHLKQFSFAEISQVAGICAINSCNTDGRVGQHHNSDGQKRHASFIFYFSSFLSHDCTPNARLVIHQKGSSYFISVIASRNIRVGDPITTSYVETFTFGTVERQSYLMDNFYFSCKCVRCLDPTELGTFMSAIKCTTNQLCKNGWLTSKNPLDLASDWICNQNHCDALVNFSVVEDVLQNVKGKMREASSLNEFAEILEMTKGKIFHKNHYLVISIECEMLRLLDVALTQVKDEAEVFRLTKWQVELCRHCLSVADTLQPGSNKFRGNLLYTLQDALLTICSYKIRQCNAGKTLGIIHKKCKIEFAEALEITKESKSILELEPVGSPEWQRSTILSLETARVKNLMSCLYFKD